ncbi:hypothetical protein OG892_34990 [Streptomyces sp. NBC_00341]|nr:hypothetical protein OG892_34990 [Streptomyces sp. NBC_00341]
MSSEQDPVPPPPGGVLWSLSGDIRALLMLPAALTLQVAHPAVGAGVDEYSVFRTDLIRPLGGEQERALRRFCGVVRVVVPLLPERLRYLPRARRARAAHREAGIRRKRAGSAGSA